MKKIDISTKKYPNTFASVDDEDYDRVSAMGKWTPLECKNGKVYAVKCFGGKPNIKLHRYIMGFPEGFQIDHKDNSGLNCQKSNLRKCTNTENSRNKRKPSNNTSGYKGISKLGDRWQAGIGHNYAHIYIGLYKTKIEAARAYDKAAMKYHGEFAWLNFPEKS